MTDSEDLPNHTIQRYRDMNQEASRRSQSEQLDVTPKDRWFRGAGVNFYPENFHDLDSFSELVERNILADMAPIPKLFSRADRIMTFGSCFAANIRKHLRSSAIGSDAIQVPEGLNNTFSILSYIRWGFTGSDPSMGQWFVKTSDGKIGHYLGRTLNEEASTYSALMSARGFIFTFGMTEIWRDRETGGVFWQGVPDEVFQENRHVFENSSFSENCANLLDLYNLIREYKPDAPIIFTVSPVTLGATFRQDAAVISDCISKSILRAAVDEVMRKKLPGLYYWPSFEMVRWFGAHIDTATFTKFSAGPDGKRLTDSSHVNEWVVKTIVEKFIDRAFSQPRD